MARKITGIRKKRGGWQAYVRVNGKLHSKMFAIDTPFADIREWREDQIELHEGTVPAAGTFGADIETYLGRVSAMPTYKQRKAHLELWAQALGRDRARRTITAAEIDGVMQEWLTAATSKATVRKRRTALQSLFVRLDGKQAKNPVRSTANPKPPKAEARGLDYVTIARILAAMPEHVSAKPDAIKTLSLARLRVAVIAYTGIPPGQLQKITPPDLQLAAGTVRILNRNKGGGVEARTLPLTAEGLDAFRAFHTARAYGKFAIESVNRAFKRAAKHAGLDPATVHLYDLRHSFGMELYRVTRDLATVARFLGHAPGSPITARYAQGANQAVDLAAVTAFSSALAQQRKAGRLPAAGAKLPAKVARFPKRKAV